MSSFLTKSPSHLTGVIPPQSGRNVVNNERIDISSPVTVSVGVAELKLQLGLSHLASFVSQQLLDVVGVAGGQPLKERHRQLGAVLSAHNDVGQ